SSLAVRARANTGRPRARAGRHRRTLPAGDLRALPKDVPLPMTEPASARSLSSSARMSGSALTRISSLDWPDRARSPTPHAPHSPRPPGPRWIAEGAPGTAEGARRPPRAHAPSRGSPGAAQRRPVADVRARERKVAAQLLPRGRSLARRALLSRLLGESKYGTAESARRPPPADRKSVG